MTMRKMKRVLAAGLGMVMLLSSVSVNATEQEKYSPENFEQMVDAFFEEKMNEYEIPGAAVAVVEHGKVVLEKSYGFSNVEENKAFCNDTTFRIASITKTFTAAALLQLVEQGKVDLATDILTYLPELKIENPYEVPVTVEHLLTYTSGIDSSSLQELSHEEIEMPCGYLLKEMNQKDLTVVTEPGTHIAYCSYGVVLEGCIIEAVSGESCAAYIENHILNPLGMNDTKMSMKDEALSNGYICMNNQLTEYTMDGYFKLYPEGGLISSIRDMTKFITMFLENGNYQGKQILSAKTTKSMQQQAITFDELLPGMCYGFGEYDEQGVRVVGHGGYAPDGFLSQVDLYPQYESGTFVIVNQGSNNDITTDFRTFYVNTKGWAADVKPVETDKGQEQEYKVTGSYRFSDYSKTTLCKGDAFGGIGEVEVTAGSNDEIIMKGINEFTGKAYEYEAEKLDETHYRIKDDMRYIVFLTEGNDVVGMAMTDDSWHGYYEKIKWYETGKVQVPVVVVAILMYLGCLLVLLGKFLYRIVKKNKYLIERWDKKRYVMQGWISFMNAGFLIYSLFRWGDRLRYSIPLDVKINLMMPIAGMVGTILFIGMNVKEYKDGTGKIRCRIWDTCFLIVSVIYLCVLNYWKLFGFQI